MGIKKIEYIPVSKLSKETKQKYNLKEDDRYAQIKIKNPDTSDNIEVNGVQSAVDEVKKSFRGKKGLENFKL